MSNFWRDRPVLVTGATGFLGDWLTCRLVQLGADVVCLVRDMPRVVPTGVNLVFGDVTDQRLIERALGEYQIRTVFHLAAQAQVCVASDNPISTFDTNIRGTWAVLEASRRTCVERVIVTSSDKAYGEQPQLPYTENMPLLGMHPYDSSKASADRMAQTYAAQWDLPVRIVRFGNLFGGGDRTWSRLVPGTIRRLLRNEPPLLRGGGNAVRDWLYVEDAVDAYLALAQIWPTEIAFNFSLGIRLSAITVITQIAAVMGTTIETYTHVPSLPGEITAQTLDCSLARQVLGWAPRHSFADGLAKTVAWYMENLW